jgi:hypothetical protein
MTVNTVYHTTMAFMLLLLLLLPQGTLSVTACCCQHWVPFLPQQMAIKMSCTDAS